MKNKYLMICIGAMVAAAFIWGCQKELPKNSKFPVTAQALEDPCQIDFELVCGTEIPHYASAQDYEDMYTCLEATYEAHNNTYEAMYSSLSDDDYDNQVDLDAFNEEEPLDDWENIKGFVSLRTRLNQEEVTWLANSMVGADPFDHALCDIITMTMINTDGDVKIGSDLIHFYADGSTLTIFGGNCEEFALAKASSGYTSANLLRIQWQAPETCESHEYDKDLVVYASGYKYYKWRVDFDSYIARSRAKSVIRNFKKKNGNWKKFAAKSYVYIGGTIWNNECLMNSALSYDDKTKRRKRVAVRTWAFTFGKIKTGNIRGTFRLIEPNITLNEDIDW